MTRQNKIEPKPEGDAGLPVYADLIGLKRLQTTKPWCRLRPRTAPYLDLMEDAFYRSHQSKEIGFLQIIEHLAAVQEDARRTALQHGMDIPRIHLVGKNQLQFQGEVKPPTRQPFEHCFRGFARQLQWASALVRNISGGFAAFRCMLPAEFNAIRIRFGSASGLQSPTFHEIELRLGLIERNIHKFRWGAGELASYKQTLTSAERELIENHPTREERPMQGFDSDCPEFEAELMRCLVEPNLRDLVAWLALDSNPPSLEFKRFLAACVKLDCNWRSLNVTHQKVARHFVKGSGTGAGPAFLVRANDPSDQVRLWAFPFLLDLHKP